MRTVWPMKIVQIIITTAMATLIFLLLNETGVFKGSYLVPFESGWLEDFSTLFMIFLPFITLIVAVMYTMKKWLARQYEGKEEETIYYYFILVIVVNFIIVLVIQFVFLERINSYSWLLPIATLITFESFEMLSTRKKRGTT